MDHDAIRALFGATINEIRLRHGKYALLFFQTAAGAKKALDLNGKSIQGAKVTTEAAKSKTTRDKSEYATTVFVGHLPGAVTKEAVKKHFERFGTVTKVRVYDSRHQGFVYFNSNDAAKKALKLEEPLFNHKLDIKLSYRTKNTTTAASKEGKTKEAAKPAAKPASAATKTPAAATKASAKTVPAKAAPAKTVPAKAAPAKKK
jgi:hypothetical protein